jgi:hypothetical protein
MHLSTLQKIALQIIQNGERRNSEGQLSIENAYNEDVILSRPLTFHYVIQMKSWSYDVTT